MQSTLRLPMLNGAWRIYAPQKRDPWLRPAAPIQSRVAYTAAHVVCDPLVDANPVTDSHLDWEATLAYRRHLWSLGFAVAEVMDTAQRGLGLCWNTAQELIRRSVADARAHEGAAIACGTRTDHLAPGEAKSLRAVEAAYEEQCAFVEAQGSRIILMASPALAACAIGSDDYVAVYDRVLSQVAQPVIIHWLGDAFDPELAGHWGADDVDEATAVCLEIIRRHGSKVDGIKLSLLDQQREIDMRRQLPSGVRMFTGDDLNYPDLFRGDGREHRDALLGIFDAIAPAASAALRALGAGDPERYDASMAPTVLLSRYIFQAPTRFCKAGIVFLAYLNGHQRHFRMVGGTGGSSLYCPPCPALRPCSRSRAASGSRARDRSDGQGSGNRGYRMRRQAAAGLPGGRGVFKRWRPVGDMAIRPFDLTADPHSS